MATPDSGRSLFLTRYVFVFWLWFGLVMVYAFRVNLSVAVLPMAEQYHWSKAEKGFVLSSFFIGYLFGQIPGGWLATTYGGKYVFGVGVLTTSLLTMLLPLATCWDFHCKNTSDSHLWSLITLRIFMGLFESVTYPALFAMLSKWAPADERSKMVSIAFSGAMIGTAATFPVSGVILSWDAPLFGRWEGLFYDLGLVGVLWFCMFSYFVTEYPEDHPSISSEECAFIVKSRGKAKSAKVPRSVWVALFTNKHVLALYCCHFVNNWSLYTFLSYLPTYLLKVLHFDMTASAIYSVLPYLTMFLVQCVGGGLADLLIVKRVFSRTNTRIFMVILGNLLPSIALVWLSYESDPGQAFILMTAAVGLSGFVYSGYPAVTIDMSPKFSGVVYSVSNLIATFPGIISPLLTSSLTKHDTQEEWRSVFFIAASLYVLGMVVWSLFCSAELQPELNVGIAYEEIDGTIQKDESLLPVLRE